MNSAVANEPRCETKQLYPAVPQLHQHKEAVSYSLLSESQLIVRHLITLQECCSSYLRLGNIRVTAVNW